MNIWFRISFIAFLKTSYIQQFISPKDDFFPRMQSDITPKIFFEQRWISLCSSCDVYKFYSYWLIENKIIEIIHIIWGFKCKIKILLFFKIPYFKKQFKIPYVSFHFSFPNWKNWLSKEFGNSDDIDSIGSTHLKW